MTLDRRPAGLRFWLITLAAVVGMGVTASLGRWQLSRAAEKEALQHLLDERARLPAVDAASLLAARPSAGADLAAVLHRAVVLEGYWVPEHTVYLDNRQMQGHPGFFVLTPLRLARPEAGQERGKEGAAEPGVVLVQRGWVARNFQDRQQLPAVPTPAQRVRIEGRVAAAPSRLYEFQDRPDGQGFSRIRQNLDLAAFRTETGLALAPFTVLQTGTASDGLLRDWPVVGTGVEKHYG